MYLVCEGGGGGERGGNRGKGKDGKCIRGRGCTSGGLGEADEGRYRVWGGMGMGGGGVIEWVEGGRGVSEGNREGEVKEGEGGEWVGGGGVLCEEIVEVRGTGEWEAEGGKGDRVKEGEGGGLEVCFGIGWEWGGGEGGWSRLGTKR